MGLVIELEERRRQKQISLPASSQEQLPAVLSRLLAAGAVEFARVALDAWANREMEPEELLELCATYASVAGLENV